MAKKRLNVAMTYAAHDNGDRSLRFNKEADALLKDGHVLVHYVGNADDIFAIEVRMVRMVSSKDQSPGGAEVMEPEDHPARKGGTMKNW